jgi:hypothetical protein
MLCVYTRLSHPEALLLLLLLLPVVVEEAQGIEI